MLLSRYSNWTKLSVSPLVCWQPESILTISLSCSHCSWRSSNLRSMQRVRVVIEHGRLSRGAWSTGRILLDGLMDELRPWRRLNILLGATAWLYLVVDIHFRPLAQRHQDTWERHQSVAHCVLTSEWHRNTWPKRKNVYQNLKLCHQILVVLVLLIC